MVPKNSWAGFLWRAWLLCALVLYGFVGSGQVMAQGRPDPEQGPGGPILVLTAGHADYGKYYAEVLRTEGLNHFAVADVATLSASTLAGYDVVILAKTSLTAVQATTLEAWVQGGGNLIAMAPDASLSSLLGLTPAPGTPLSNGYLRVETASAPGAGIVGETLQFHGTAALFTLNGAAALATLYSDATTATVHPAISLRAHGAGNAAAFTYDLATSIVQTRQGNPAWSASDRDGLSPIRSNDMFYGPASFDPRSNWIDLNRVAIPQADEQQRLLSNLILHINANRKPLPRFWYFPNGRKAVVVMTGDDHANAGTIGRFESFKTRSTPGCSVANWECIRGTSYVYPDTPMTAAQAAQFTAEGFEVGLHLSTGCANFTAASLDANYASQIQLFNQAFPGAGSPRTQRHHCIVWSDWVTGAQVQASHGIALDTSYYYWPPTWVNNVPGLFTGSAMPMRFARQDGVLVDVYMAATQMTDESGQAYPLTPNTLLDRAVGAEGYYGAYVVNAHTDAVASAEADAVIGSAVARGVPVITAGQLLTWVDARNASNFGAIAFGSGTLTFTVSRDAAAQGLTGMLPLRFGTSVLNGLTRAGSPVAYTNSVIKGVEYAHFDAVSGSYVATYGADTTGPTVTGTSPLAGATGVVASTAVTVTFNEAIDPSTIAAGTFFLVTATNSTVPAALTYDSANRRAILTPLAPLADNASYTVTVRGGATDPRVKDLAGNALAASQSWSFTTAQGVVCPCTAWDSATIPVTASVNDPSAVELGVKFTSDVAGYVTGVRFYKGPLNTGTHAGNLWTASGTLLATAVFTSETATGWQQVDFATPVLVQPNTVYVASYHAPNGGYAADGGFFASAGVYKAPIRLLQDGVSGGNGVFAYGSSGFPAQSFNSSNYWVDVVFSNTAPVDNTPPTVTSTAPAAGASGVSPASPVTVTFSEPVQLATLDTTTFYVRGPGNVAVPGTIAWSPASRTATFTPASPLAASTTYTVTVVGGATDPRVKDLAGNSLAASLNVAFTTSQGVGCPCSAWDASSVPTNASTSDTGAVEVGVKFTSDVAGYVSGVRFYKGTLNTGTHVGNLWTASGTLLATAVFTTETATGWQQVDFTTPVPVQPNTVYVASYHAPNGGYASDSGFFAGAGVYRAPIRLLQDGVSGGNGVFLYGSASGFPAQSFNSSNYWVDVVFSTTAPVDNTPPTVVSTTPPAGASGVNAASAVTVTFSEPVQPATLDATTFYVRGPGNVVVPGAIGWNVASRTATFTPTLPLAASTSYTVTVVGGATDPRVKDLAGNALAAVSTWTFTTSAGCGAGANAIVAENCQPGNPASQWDVVGAGDPTIQGFATNISVNRGSVVSFKVNTNANAYRLDIYRMGYYAGMGARLVATVLPSTTLPQSQPACLSDAATGLIDCGNWAVSASWQVPAGAVSGIYFAKLVRTDTGGASHIFFIVRNDASTSDIVFQTSDTTWQAYNSWGGNSLYTGSPAGRAYKVSYNRPFNTREVDGGQDWVFNAEYPMVRWLEANGYDLTYISGIDTDRSGGLLTNHRAFLSVGHDEYWSGAQRSNVEAARAAGVNLAFFSGNEIFWKIRWENSIDGSGTPYRTLVSYKETLDSAKTDPNPTWTGTWRDPRFSPPSDGGKPENALSGTIFLVNSGTTGITVPAEEGKLRFWRNTSVAALAPGQVATLPNGTLGYEWDTEADNGFRPPGLMRMSDTTANDVVILTDFGSSYAGGTANHALTMYRHAGGARVFGAGTVQWSWGLDAQHDRSGTPADVRMQQATVNLLADMLAQPTTLQSGLVTASASTDNTPPISSITAPSAGNIAAGAMTITGAATDSGGGVVGGVEVSTDNGATWRRASGRANWTYAWTPSSGTFVIKSRAVDDSGNLEVPGSGVTVTVAARECPCTIWPSTATPLLASSADTSAVNLGIRFRVDQSGVITGLRFYKGPNNTGTHIGTLWTSTGVQLAQATFTSETTTGWQQVDFASPVPVATGVDYVASYHAPNGGYGFDANYFASAPFSNAPLHALQSAPGAANGVYAYAGATAFPTSTYQASNYWVDVVFTPGADATPPTVSTRFPAAGATNIAGTTTVRATFDEAMNAATIGASTFELRDSSNASVSGTVTYDAGTRVATLTPSANLAAGGVYTATVRGGATDPRVKDAAGNAMAANATWSFTIAPPTPPTIIARSPAPGTTGVAGTANVTATFAIAMDAATITTSTFVLRDAANAIVPAGVTYDTASRVVTLNPTPNLNGGATYTATVVGGAAGVKSSVGVPLAADVTWTFTIEGSVPTITARSPAPGATGVSATANVTATFSEAMNAATITASSFELRDANGVLVPAVVSYSTSSRVATLNPTPSLSVGTVYTARVVGSAVTDTAGTPLGADSTWTFTITPPTITSRSPAVGATNVGSTANVTATFSVAMDASTITTSTVILRDAVNAIVPAVVTYSSSNRVATLNPTPNLVAGAVYVATVVGGAAGVKTTAGGPLAADVVWSFTVETAAPTITARSPASGATNVSRTANVTVTFNESMDPATINASTFELRDPANTVVPAVVTYNTSTRVATLNPAPTLLPSRVYTARVIGGGPKDLAGNAIVANSSWSFTTVADTTAPSISARSPASGATGVGRTSAVVVTFNDDMDATTINTSTFELRAGATIVAANVTYNAATRQVTVQPSATLAASTVHTVTVRGGVSDPRVKDVGGNAMAGTSTWSFTTGL